MIFFSIQLGMVWFNQKNIYANKWSCASLMIDPDFSSSLLHIGMPRSLFYVFMKKSSHNLFSVNFFPLQNYERLLIFMLWNSVKSWNCAQICVAKVWLLPSNLFILIGQQWIISLFSQNMTPEMVCPVRRKRKKMERKRKRNHKFADWPNSKLPTREFFFPQIYWLFGLFLAFFVLT